MRTLILSLALLGACADAPSGSAAPSVAPTEALRTASTVDRLDALEAQTAALATQLKAAQARIDALAAENKDQASRIEALTSAQKSAGDALAGLRGAEAYSGAVASASLDYLLRAAGGPGRQGGHLTVLEDYRAALASAGLVAPTGTTDALVTALLESDPETGAQGPRVDGVGTAIALRMRKRPDLLFQAWESAISDYVTEIHDNPLHGDGSPNLNPLHDLAGRLDLAVDDWQGEVAWLKREVAVADDDLQQQLTALGAETCAVGALSVALWTGDDVAADEAFLRLNGDGRFQACLVDKVR